MNGRSVHEVGRESNGRALAGPKTPQETRNSWAAASCRAASSWLHRQEQTRWKITEANAAPHAAGCYAISCGPQLLYIGSALNIRHRLQEHGLCNRWQRRHCRFGQVDELTVRVAYAARRGDHLRREFRLIARIKPPFNIAHAQRPRRPRD